MHKLKNNKNLSNPSELIIKPHVTLLVSSTNAKTCFKSLWQAHIGFCLKQHQKDGLSQGVQHQGHVYVSTKSCLYVDIVSPWIQIVCTLLVANRARMVVNHPQASSFMTLTI